MNQLTTSLWGDESFTAVAVKENFLRMLEIVIKDTTPPLYYLALFVWTRIFGFSELAIRGLSIFFYLGTVFIVYLIAKKIGGRIAGCLAALLTLANPFLFPFAFEGRMYAILVFTVTLSFYFFFLAEAKKKGRTSRVLSRGGGHFFNNNFGYILASAAALYSHHYAILPLVFQFFWRLSQTKNLKKNWFKFLKPYLIITLLYLPWLYPFYKQVTMVSTQGFWLQKPTIKDVSHLFLKYLRGNIVFPWQKYLPLLAVLILVLKKWSLKFKQNVVFLGWSFIPVILAFLLSLGKTSIFYDRYLIFIIPGLMLLLGTGWRKISLPLILIFSFVLLWVNLYYFTHPSKRPFRQLADYIKQEITPADFLINYNCQAHHLWETKYYGLTAPLYAPAANLPYYVGTAQMTEEDIVRQLPSKDRIGVISSEEPESMKINNYQLLNYKKFGSLSFSWFVKNEKD